MCALPIRNKSVRSEQRKAGPISLSNGSSSSLGFIFQAISGEYGAALAQSRPTQISSPSYTIADRVPIKMFEVTEICFQNFTVVVGMKRCASLLIYR